MALQEQQRADVERLKELTVKEEELRQRRAELDQELAEVARLEAQRDHFFREEAELQRAVALERRKVRELEMSRKAQQEMEAERLSLQGYGCRTRGSETMAFTISTGREERRDRLGGCKRACVLS